MQANANITVARVEAEQAKRAAAQAEEASKTATSAAAAAFGAQITRKLAETEMKERMRRATLRSIRPSSRRPLRKRCDASRWLGAVDRRRRGRGRGGRRCRAKESPCRGQGVLCRQLAWRWMPSRIRSCPLRRSTSAAGWSLDGATLDIAAQPPNPRRRHHHHRRRHHRRRRLPPPPPPAAAAATTTQAAATQAATPPPPSAPPSPPPPAPPPLPPPPLTASHDAATRAATIATASLAASFTTATLAASSFAASLAGAPLPASRSSARWRPFLLYRIPFRAASTIPTLLHNLLSRWWEEAVEAVSTTAISTARTAGFFSPLGRLCRRREEGTATRASSATTSTATAKAFGGVGWARRA